MESTRYSCQILIELEFARQIFEKYSYFKFNEICPLEAQLFSADGHTDGRTGQTRRSE
jgi:hypothetical protein